MLKIWKNHFQIFLFKILALSLHYKIIYMKARKLEYKTFNYMQELVDFFNEHPEYQLISHAYKKMDLITAVYYIYNLNNNYGN